MKQPDSLAAAGSGHDDRVETSCRDGIKESAQKGHGPNFLICSNALPARSWISGGSRRRRPLLAPGYGPAALPALRRTSSAARSALEWEANDSPLAATLSLPRHARQRHCPPESENNSNLAVAAPPLKVRQARWALPAEAKVSPAQATISPFSP